MADLTVQEEQTIYDLAIQAYGTVAGVFQLIEDNPWLSLDDNPEVGKKVLVNGQTLDFATEIEKYVTRKKIVPANGGGKDPGISAFSNGFKQDSVT